MNYPLKSCHFGAANGRPIIYFHGAPGAPEECAIFDNHGKENGLTFICFDRFSIDSSVDDEAYYQLLATEILAAAAGRQVDVIGFSIGAFVALQICRLIPNAVRSLHLVSAAAPLEAGDFLQAMAGKHVFQLAQKLPILFVLLSYWQGLLALIFPGALFRLLFSNAAGGDAALAANRDFRLGIINILKKCFIGRTTGYIRDVMAYVRPWKSTLADISVNTYIWHGAADNWSPKSMAEYLRSALPNCSHIEILSSLSHYSCLHEVAPKICNHLSKA